MSQKRQRIGDLLVAKGVITRATAETVAVETVLADTRFASVLIYKGHPSETQVLEVLSEQIGVPAVDLMKVVIPPDVLTRIPSTVARRHTMLPLKVEGSTLLLAMANPADQDVVNEVSFATGLTVLPHLGLHHRLIDAIAKAYADVDETYTGLSADAKAIKAGNFVAIITVGPNVEPEPLTEAEEEAIELELADEPLDLGESMIIETEVEQPAAADSKASSGGDSSEATDRQRVVLVVDDEKDIQKLVFNALTPMGHKVIAATRGLEALRLIKTKRPDLLVLDAMLPEVHGFEICRKVKESKRFRDTPVLMISAIYRGWRIAADIEALYGVDVFLEKPFRISDLRRHAERLLANAPRGPADDTLGDDGQTHYDAGVAAYKAKDFTVAFSELREAEALEPFSAKIQFMIGRVLEQQDRAFQAIYHYERAIELNPSLFPATKNLALLYQGKGFKHKAIEMWERSLRAAPSPEVRDQIKQHLVSIL